MGANRRAVDVVVPALRHGLGESNGGALPDARCAPSSEAPKDRVPIAVLLWDVAPWRAGPQPPQDAIDDIAIVLGRPTTPSLSNIPFNRQ